MFEFEVTSLGKEFGFSLIELFVQEGKYAVDFGFNGLGACIDGLAHFLELCISVLKKSVVLLLHGAHKLGEIPAQMLFQDRHELDVVADVGSVRRTGSGGSRVSAIAKIVVGRIMSASREAAVSTQQLITIKAISILFFVMNRAETLLFEKTFLLELSEANDMMGSKMGFGVK